MVTPLSQRKNNSEKELNIIILCAGKGTRIQKNYPSIPKALIKIKEFDNKPILEIVLNTIFLNKKVNQAWVVSGHLRGKIKSFLSKFISVNQILSDKVLSIDASENYEKGPLFSLLSVASTNQISNNQIYLVIPGDTIYDNDLIDEVVNITLTHYQSKSKAPAIFYREIDESNIKELKGFNQAIKILTTAIVNENGVVIEILKKIREETINNISKEQISKQLFPFFALDNDFLMNLAIVAPKMGVNTIYSALNVLKKAYQIQAYKIESKGSFFDIDTKKDLKKLIKNKKSGQ